MAGVECDGRLNPPSFRPCDIAPVASKRAWYLLIATGHASQIRGRCERSPNITPWGSFNEEIRGIPLDALGSRVEALAPDAHRSEQRHHMHPIRAEYPEVSCRKVKQRI